MKSVVLALLALALVVIFALIAWRSADQRANRQLWASLASHQPSAPARFDLSSIADLPDAAQRYFRFAISPGTRLYTVAEISMQGEFSLGNKDDPKYLPMRAEQLLASPHGFVWNLRAGEGVMKISGSDVAGDGSSWSRFWLLGIAPVARAGGSPDHARAAFGRYVAEAVFWTPAALLPSDHVRWEAIDDSTARVIVTHLGLQQAVDVFVDVDGRLNKVVFQRWSDANQQKVFQLQPFGGFLSEYKTFEGFRLPTRVEAGNFFDTDDYFPFFKVTVTSIRFVAPSDSE